MSKKKKKKLSKKKRQILFEKEQKENLSKKKKETLSEKEQKENLSKEQKETLSQAESRLSAETESYPLANCLIPYFDEENEALSLDKQALKKAIILLENGADPNLTSPSMPNLPPLMLAIMLGKGNDGTNNENDILPLIGLLLEKGANPDFVYSEGITPLQIAAENDLPEVMQLLLKTPFLRITIDDVYTIEYTKNDILNFNSLSDFDVYNIESTATSLKGKLYFDPDHNDFPSVSEEFAVDAENPMCVVRTGIMTVSRMEDYKFTFELLALEEPKLPVSQELGEIEK